MKLIDGKATAEAIKAEIAATVEQMVAEGRKRPHLAAILVGHDGGSETYVAHKVKACEQCGFKSTLIRFEDNITEQTLLDQIAALNADPDIDGCAQLADYRRSGYTRGHMAPAADMRWSQQAMDACFLLTNMSPQDNSLNSGAWGRLEERSRAWAARDSAITIICGPVLTDRLTRTIGKSRIPVPERYFKVIIAPFANPPRGIGFIMPNAKVEGGMAAAATTIDEIEAITGFDFFSTLPDHIENTIEAQSNLPQWNNTSKKRSR